MWQGYRLCGWGIVVRFEAGAKHISLLYSVQASGAHSSSLSVDIRVDHQMEWSWPLPSTAASYTHYLAVCCDWWCMSGVKHISFVVDTQNSCVTGLFTFNAKTTACFRSKIRPWNDNFFKRRGVNKHTIYTLIKTYNNKKKRRKLVKILPYFVTDGRSDTSLSL